MSLLQNEIKANFQQFTTDWQSEMATVIAALSVNGGSYLDSYTRMTSLQAWRQHLESLISAGSLAFFLEAQNDALTSHVFARAGSWRAALKSLRSCIDNILFCCYYKDHPVELELWETGNHKPTFSDLFTYLENHPLRISVQQIDANPVLRAEYSTLSKAVHASAKHFRMTKDIKQTQLWSASQTSRGMWQTREENVLAGINLMLLTLFRGSLQGASASALRDVVSLSIPSSRFSLIKQHLGVVLQ